jgi:predicted MFS family arabinose efflux permease
MRQSQRRHVRKPVVVERPASYRHRIVAALGAAQTLAWASSYYLIAVVATPMARSFHVGETAIYVAFSSALVVTAFLGPRVGRLIDANGGRNVLATSSAFFAAGLAILGMAQSLKMLWVGWIVIGIGMTTGLYEAAFATVGGILGADARPAITGITLIAGFASTVGWTLTSWGNAQWGWRQSCLIWAATHLVMGLPLNLFGLPKYRAGANVVGERRPRLDALVDRRMWILAIAFAATSLVSTGMATQLPRLLQLGGATAGSATAAVALLGPAQVGARVLEAAWARHIGPVVAAGVAIVLHPVGVLLFLLGGVGYAVPLSVLHGAGNGMLTIAKGAVPMSVFGPNDYGYRLAVIGAPGRLCQAGAPVAFSLLIDRWGTGALLLSSGAYLTAALCLWTVRASKSISTR